MTTVEIMAPGIGGMLHVVASFTAAKPRDAHASAQDWLKRHKDISQGIQDGTARVFLNGVDLNVKERLQERDEEERTGLENLNAAYHKGLALMRPVAIAGGNAVLYPVDLREGVDCTELVPDVQKPDREDGCWATVVDSNWRGYVVWSCKRRARSEKMTCWQHAGFEVDARRLKRIGI